MLVLKRNEYQEIEIIHVGTGDKLIIVAYECQYGSVKLGFEDQAHNFDIMRTEAKWKGGK